MYEKSRLENGFTMVELMVSSAILAVVSIVMLYGMVLNMQLQYNSRTTDTAIADLMAVKDQILATPFEPLKEYYPDGTTIPGVNKVPGEIITISYPADASATATLVLIRLDINWLDNKKNLRSRNLSFWKKK